MKITLSLIEKLIRLRSGESLPASALRGEWVEELLRDGTLINCSHGSKRSIIASSPLTLEQALGLIDERLGNLDVMKRIYSGNSLRSGTSCCVWKFQIGTSTFLSWLSCKFLRTYLLPIKWARDSCSTTRRDISLCF